MIFINYRRPNVYRDILERFSEYSRYLSFGVVKGFVAEKLKWVGTMLFKHRNNLQTNKHKTMIGFFSDKEMFLNEYANVDTLASVFIFDAKPYLPDIYYELASRQYSKIGIEYTEYDKIEYVDASGNIIEAMDYDGANSRLVNHKYGDAPVFITAGYQIPIDDTGTKLVYVFEPEHDGSQVNFNGFEILMADSHKDPYTNSYLKAFFDQTVSNVIVEGEYIGADLMSSAPTMTGVGKSPRKGTGVLEPDSPTITGVGTWTIAP